jgi:hypothetical protein
VKDLGWTDACQIRVGDSLPSHDGRWITVDAVIDTGETEPVYNVRIAEFHTYFVGCDEWGFSVWAHNACATIYEYAGMMPGQLGHHWSIKIDNGNASMHTQQSNDQLPPPAANVGWLSWHPDAWITNMNTFQATTPVLSTHTVQISDAGAINAMAFQTSELATHNAMHPYPYDIVSRSCATHILDVLNAAGVQGVPAPPTNALDAMALVQYLQGL